MDAAVFNRIYQDTVINPLLRNGFVRNRANVYLTTDETVLALLRVQNKFDALLRSTSLIVCIRHKFLRELVELKVPAPFVADIDDYPIKERPSALPSFRSSWRYQPKNLGTHDTDYDRISYGTLEANEVQDILTPLVDAVLSRGRALLVRLTPAEMLQQLRDHGEGAWCEKVWIEDYTNYLGEVRV